MMKRGFTIVELLMVIGVIMILMGIVVTTASSSVRMSRTRKTEALQKLAQEGLATYYAQKGEWPVEPSNSTQEDTVELSAEEVRNSFLAIIKEYKKGNPLMDISGLYVSTSVQEPVKETLPNGSVRYHAASGAAGMDFLEAIRGSKKNSGGQKVYTTNMRFGYPHPESGRFMRFRIVYYPAADKMTVKQWDW